MFNTMKTMSMTALAALALAGAVSTPAFANHQDGRQAHRHDTRGNDNDALVGGLLGAVVGGVVGSEIAGRGNRTEGAVVGAVVGGLAGAAIADGGNDRRYDNRRYNSRSGLQYRSGYSDYDYNYNRNRYSTYRGQSHNRYGYGHNRYGSRSSIHNRGGFSSNRRHSFRK